MSTILAHPQSISPVQPQLRPRATTWSYRARSVLDGLLRVFALVRAASEVESAPPARRQAVARRRLSELGILG